MSISNSDDEDYDGDYDGEQALVKTVGRIFVIIGIFVISLVGWALTSIIRGN